MSRKELFFYLAMALIFVLALSVRIKTYFLSTFLGHDECSLAGSILSRSLSSLFEPLEYEQKAPAIFMVLNKINFLLFGGEILTLKIVPFLSGIFSVFVFYKLSSKFLTKNYSIFIANFLFAINYQLIYWAQKFKPYSFDVLIFMLSLLFFYRLDLKSISYKKCIVFSFFSIILVLSSFTSSFVIGGYVFYCLLNKIDYKKIIAFSVPLIAFCSTYYYKVLYGVQANEVANYLNYWNDGFLKLNIKSLLLIFKENFVFFFTPNNFVLFGMILFFTGFILILKERSNKLNQIICLSFVGIAFASFLHIYPIWQRTALYLVPVWILFMIKPLEYLKNSKKVLGACTILLTLACFSGYQYKYLSNFFSADIFAHTDAITTFPVLINRISDDDIIVVNSTTKADFIYYSQLYNFSARKYFILPISRYDKNYYESLLKNLPKGHNYWFIFGWEYSHRIDNSENCIATHLKNYLKEGKIEILEEYQDKSSILIKTKF